MTMGSENLRPSLALPAFFADAEIASRLAAGQRFNAYEGHRGIHIGIGPVTAFLGFAEAGSLEAAEAIVDALRLAAEQQPLTSCLAAQVTA